MPSEHSAVLLPEADNNYCVGDSLFNSALRFGCVDILKIFIEYTPGLAEAKNVEGELVLGGCLERRGKRTRTIRYLFQEVHMVINAVDKLGRTLVYSVAMQGNLELVKLLHDLGVDLQTEDNTGQTLQEVASTAGHVSLSTWLTACTGDVTQSRARKYHLALELIAMLRDHVIEQIALSNYHLSFLGETGLEQFANVKAKWFVKGIDEKLATLYSTRHSRQVLQQFKDDLTAKSALL